MRSGTGFLIPILLALLMPVSASAQTPDVTVGEIGFPNLVWGEQTLKFEVTNNTDWLKFLMVETDVVFLDSYVESHRSRQVNYVLEPSATITVEPAIDIPGSYGQAEVWIRIHAAVDTLDDLALGELVHEQPIRLTFHAPESIQDFRQERLVVPPLLQASPYLDNELDLFILLFLSQRKSVDEIAALTGADRAMLDAEIARLTAGNYVARNGESFTNAIPVISAKEAAEGRAIADRLATAMAGKITANLAGLPALEDSLTAAGVLDSKSKSFIGGASLFDNKYPLVVGLLLWDRLGRRFINGSAPLEIYKQTDPCRPYIGQYCYMVQGGDFFNGHQYYEATYRSKSVSFLLGDQIPEYKCNPGWQSRPRLTAGKDYEVTSAFTPQSVHFDGNLMAPALDLLERGIEDDMRAAVEELMALHQQLDAGAFTAGVKYWFWNLTATLTTRQLVDAGVLVRDGNGQYRFTGKI